MANYAYVVTDSNNTEIKGTISCENQVEALEQLKSKGYTVISLNAAVLGGGDDKQKGGGGPKPKIKELAVFCRQFVAIAEAGVPVVSVLDMLGCQTENKRLQFAIYDCKDQIQGGESFSDAMAMHPKVFPKMLVTLAAAGEQSGSLETSFLRMATQFEKEAHLQSMIKKAGVYPSVVLCVALAVVVVMLVFVVPNFEQMFVDMGTELPAITVFVVNLSAYLQDKWYLVIGYGIGGFVLLMKFLKSPTGISMTSLLTLRLPVVKNLVTKTACARMARTLSTLLGSGMGIIETIEITAETMTNLVFKKAIHNVGEEVSLGQNMAEPLEEAKIFPPLVYHMIHIGEETGNTEKMLDTLAGYYEEEVEAATEALMSLLEPLTIILLAVLVGGIIGSVMAPMATMYDELSKL